MNREQLKALGLTDDQIEAVMAEHGKTVNKTKEQLDAITAERDDLKSQITERDAQLEELKTKATGNEDLQKQIQELQDQNKQIQQDYEAKIQQQAFDHSLNNALLGAKVKNVKAVRALLDTESIKLDGETLLGLDDQLKALRESDAYLFGDSEPQEPGKPTFTTGQHQKPGNTDAFASILLGKK